MTNVMNDNIDFNKSHYLGQLGAVQLRKKLILFTQDVTFPGDVEEVMVTAVGGGRGGGGGSPGQGYASGVSGPGANGGSGTKAQTAFAAITNPLVLCEIGNAGNGGQGGVQTVAINTSGQPGTSGGDTKFIPYFPGTKLTFYGAKQANLGGSNVTTTGPVAVPQMIRVPEIESSAGAGGNSSANGTDGGDCTGSLGGDNGIAGPNSGGGSGGGGGGGLQDGADGGDGGTVVPIVAGLGRFMMMSAVEGANVPYYAISGFPTLSTGFNGTVYGMEEVSAITIVIGDFTNYSGTTKNRIVGLHSDGSYNASFNTATGIAFNNGVRAIAKDGSTKVVVGGLFTSFNGNAKNRLTRITSGGGLDNSLNVGTGLNNTVNAITLDASSRILVGGDFTSYNGSARNRLVRISNLGVIDAVFSNTFANGSVNAIAVDSLGRIYVGGAFTTFNGTANRNRIIRVDATTGAIDAGFDIGLPASATSGFNGIVRTIAVQSDDKIIVGGDFTSYRGTTVNRIARLNTNGTLDASFVIGTGFNGVVRSIRMQTYPVASGQLIVGGDFTLYNGITQNRISRVESNGSLGLAAIIGTPAPFVSLINNGAVYAVSTNQGGGQIIAGGTFTNAASDVTDILGVDGMIGGYGAGGGGGGGSAKVASYPTRGGRGGNAGQGYMILHYFSKFE